MARRRRWKQDEQLTFLDKAGKKVRDRRGGYRPGSGRKPKNGVRAGMPHRRRTRLLAANPTHVTLRVLPIVQTLRDFDLYPAFRKASIAAAKHGQAMDNGMWFQITHMSIQSNHLHLIVEASGKVALARGMQGFQISAAKWLNKAISKRRKQRRTGSVFADRYHAQPLTSPQQTRRALAYVLNNWRKHEQDRTRTTSAWRVDPFSSGGTFTGWRELVELGLARWQLRDDYEPLVVSDPRTWLLRIGWRRYGLVSCAELPTAKLFEHA